MSLLETRAAVIVSTTSVASPKDIGLGAVVDRERKLIKSRRGLAIDDRRENLFLISTYFMDRIA